MRTGDLYEALGWTQGGAYWRRRKEEVRLSVLVRVAHIVGAPFGSYIEDVFKELWKRCPGARTRRLIPRAVPPPGVDPLISAVSDYKTRVTRAKAEE